MPLLQVNGCPDDVYERIGQVARAEHRSMAQQTIVLLRQALNAPESNEARRARVLAQADQSRANTSTSAYDPAASIREDRDR